MKTMFFLFLVVFMCFQTACCDKNALDNFNNRISSLENRKVSSETAVLIAKGEMSTRIDLKNFDITSVNEGIDYWEVHFTSKCDGCLDNKPYVIISKANGEVIRTYIYGEPSK